jgi:hypothetical protein
MIKKTNSIKIVALIEHMMWKGSEIRQSSGFFTGNFHAIIE